MVDDAGIITCIGNDFSYKMDQRLANLYEVKVNQEAQSRQMQILNFRDYQFPKLTLKANSQSILQIQ
jgi:hypothetical protein